MKTQTFEKFRGLQIQANSFEGVDGTLEKADNVVISRDNIVQKRRGARSEYYMPETINALADYNGSKFAIADHVYRLDGTATGTAYSTNNATAITTRKIAHGLQDGDYVTDYLVSDEDFVAGFETRFADFFGQQAITTEFTVSGAASGANTIIMLANHGLQSGDTVYIKTSAISATGATLVASRLTANTFQVTLAATGTGAMVVRFVDAFRTIATKSSTATASGTASWQDYKLLSGDTFTTDDYVPVLKTGKNCYWGANEGLHCIEATTGPVRKAGVPPALDTDAYLSLTSGGVAANSQVAYRVTFGRKDANGTTHLSAPSDVVLLSNQPATITTLSYASGTGVLTVTDTNRIVNNGDLIYLYNVTATGGIPPDGSSVAVTGVSGTTFQFDFDDLGVSPSAVTSIDYGTRKTATLYASIPSEITSTEYYYQVYRSDSVDAEVVPDSRYKLVEQVTLTAADLARGFVSYTDILPLEVIQSNAELYTNATQEGEAQANARPPLAADLALFKGYSFFADCQQYRTLALDLIQTTDLANANTVTIAGEVYTLRGDATNASIGNDITTSSAAYATGTVTVTQAGHGLLANDTFYLISATGLTISSAVYTVATAASGTFTFTASATGTTGTLVYEARKNASGAFIVTLTEPSDTAAETIAESIDFTARSLVKACNRNSTKLYAQYVSGIDESPGKMLFTAKSLAAATFAATASDTTVGGCFSPTLPASGTTVSDFLDDSPNALYVSKYLEAEAVPIVNRFPVASQEAAILRIAALRDSLIVMKEDGIYRLNGDAPSNFSVTALDTTVILKAVKSVAVLNNSIYALTNQGVVQVTDSSVRIISRPIEPLLVGVLGKANIDSFTSGVGYESERLYLLNTIEVNTSPSYGNQIFCYNYLTDAWTTWTGNVLFSKGIVSSSTDKLLYVLAADKKDIMQERKNQNKLDYTGQDAAMQVYTKRIANMRATLGSKTVCIDVPADHGLQIGDVLSISEASFLFAAAYSGGAASIEGIRTVTSVTDKIVCFEADENAMASNVGTAYWQRGISEQDVTATTVTNSSTVTCVCNSDHGLQSGNGINVNSISAALAAAFASESDLTGYRSVTVLSPTTFTVKSSNPAIGNASGAFNMSDKRGVRNVVTAVSGFEIQPGEAFVSADRIYKIAEVEKFDSMFVCTLAVDATFSSKSLVLWHDNYNGRIKFSPITMGTGVLKQFSEFQAWFRNSSSCSQIALNFSTDSRYSDKETGWSNYVGTPEGLVTFGGWGSQPWGKFPWGGGSSVITEYGTGPAVPLRTWIPQASYLATFIQPEMVHSVAGEPLELQSIAIMGQPATHKVSK